jgi:hypothetical protein
MTLKQELLSMALGGAFGLLFGFVVVGPLAMWLARTQVRR